MIAYNNQWLYNLYVRGQAGQALQEQCIKPEMHEAICRGRQANFYTPNFFVRVGLGILTLIIISFASALFMLMSGAASHGISFVLFFVGALCYMGAEVFIRSKAHYNSGVDNMLIWMAALMLWSGVFATMDGGDSSGIGLSFAALVICSALALRFADALLSAGAALGLLGMVFFICQRAGVFAQSITPFVIMVVSAIIYVVSARVIKSKRALHYRHCLVAISVVALVSLYAAGNFYVVREIGSKISYRQPGLQPSLPLGWFFWLWTFLVPFIYIAAGILKKNVTLIRTGSPLIAVAVLTFRNYYSVLAPETAMLIGGMALFIISYSLISYLREPKGGFTFMPDSYAGNTPDLGRMITGEAVSRSAQATGRQEDNSW